MQSSYRCVIKINTPLKGNQNCTEFPPTKKTNQTSSLQELNWQSTNSFCHSLPCILIPLQYLLLHAWEQLVIQHQKQMKLDADKCKAMHTKEIHLNNSLLGLHWGPINSGKAKQKPDMHHCGKLNANICSVGISDQNGKHLVCMCKKEDGK